MDAPERYEQLIAFLDSNLPSPVDRQESADGSVQFTGGEPAEVVVSLTETSVLVSEFAGVWESAFTLAARPRREHHDADAPVVGAHPAVPPTTCSARRCGGRQHEDRAEQAEHERDANGCPASGGRGRGGAQRGGLGAK